MNVYTIVHETYGYEDNEYGSIVEIFETLDSAKIYFEMMKSNIIREYIDYTEYQTLEEMMADDNFYMDEEPTLDGNKYLFIDYDEYGHDRLRIYEKPVMKFNLEDC